MYHVTMFPRSSLDPPLEMESLLVGWIYIIIHARSNSWMLAGFNKGLRRKKVGRLVLTFSMKSLI